LEKHKIINQTTVNQFPLIWVMDSLCATCLARTERFWAQSPSRRLARSTIFLGLSRLKVGS